LSERKTWPAVLALAPVTGYFAASFLRSAMKFGSAALALSAFLIMALRSVTRLFSFWSLV
jgi:hypothetical protein